MNQRGRDTTIGSWPPGLDQAIAEMARLRASDVPAEAIPSVLSELATAQLAIAAAQGALVTRIAAAGDRNTEADKDGWLTSDEAAELLRVDRKWLYRRARNLPFCRRLSRKKLLFSEAGLRRWMATRTTR